MRDALALAGWYVLQSLTGTYLMVFTAISIVAATLARPRDWLGARFAAVVPKAALAAAVAIAALTPFLLPYLAVSREAGLSRSLEETARYSADFDRLSGGRRHLPFRGVEPPVLAGRWAVPGCDGA